MEPHLVNPPLRWWYRLHAFDEARASRRARETVERVGMAKADAVTNAQYNALMLKLREPDGC